MDPRTLLEWLWIHVYLPPLSERFDDRVRDLSDPLHVVMLLVAFETERQIGGTSNFLETCSGRYARDTVDALEIIGCDAAARQLEHVLAIAERALLEHTTLSRDSGRIGAHPFVSADWRAEAVAVSACDEVDRLGAAIDWAPVREALAQFATRNYAALVVHVPEAQRGA
jgi:hypothetical protein